MRGYLLDTNIIRLWYDDTAPEYGEVNRRIAKLDDLAPLFVSAITIGEIEYGHAVESRRPTSSQVQFSDFIAEQLPHVLPVSKTTSPHYGSLRARLFNQYAPRRGRKGLRPEQLINPVTSLILGVQENDLWIAAQAIEHNLVLVTHDAMRRIADMMSDMLAVEDWTRGSDEHQVS